MKKVAIALACIAAWLGTAGGMNASYRESAHNLHQSARQSAQTQAISLLFAVFPPAWVAVIFITGFYYSGWTLTRKPFPCKSENPKIWCDVTP